MATCPDRVDIGSVDRVDPCRNAGVEQLERRCLIGGPAEHVAPEHDWRQFDVGSTQPALLHLMHPDDLCVHQYTTKPPLQMGPKTLTAPRRHQVRRTPQNSTCAHFTKSVRSL